MYRPRKQSSQVQIEDYRQGQSRTNYNDSQQEVSSQVPKNRIASHNRTQQLASKIQDVIELCAADKQDGANEFSSIA